MLGSLDLLPDAAGQDLVRAAWQRLRDAGLPSQLDHRGVSNAPHVTLVEAPGVSAALRQDARELILPLLPLRVEVAGVIAFGGDRVTLAWALDIPDALTSAVLDLRGRLRDPGTDTRHGWIPHVSLVRRLDRDDLPRTLTELGSQRPTLSLIELRQWDPGTRTTSAVTPDGSQDDLRGGFRTTVREGTPGSPADTDVDGGDGRG